MQRFLLMLAIGLSVLTAHAATTPEDIFWTSVKKSDVIEEYRLYVEQYPRGKFIGEAWRRIGQIESEEKAALAEAKRKVEAAEVQRAKEADEAKRRAQPRLIADRYRDNGDGTVTDVTTKLQWMRCAVGQTWTGATCQGSPGSFKWDAAQQISANSGGFFDWRLPTVEELRTLLYCSGGNPRAWVGSEICRGAFIRPTVVAEAFPNTPSVAFWTSTNLINYSGSAWIVNFNYGFSTSTVKNNAYQVRQVRVSQ